MNECEFKPLGEMFMLGDDGEPVKVLDLTNIEEQTTCVDELDPGMFPIRFNDRMECTFTAEPVLTRRDAINLVRYAWGWKNNGHIRRRSLVKARAIVVKAWWKERQNDLCYR